MRILTVRFPARNGWSEKTYDYIISKEQFDNLKIVPYGTLLQITNENGYDYQKQRVRFEELKDDVLMWNTKATLWLKDISIVATKEPTVEKTFEARDCLGFALSIEDGQSLLTIKNDSIKFEERENKNMFEKIFQGLKFGAATDVKLSVYGAAFKTDDNNYVAYNDKGELIEVNSLILDEKESLCYVIPVAKDNVQVGDFIRHNNYWVKIIEILQNGYLRAEKIMAKEVVDIIPTKNIFGFDFYSKLVPLFGNFDFGADEQNVFGSLPLFMMFSNEDNNSLLPLLLMGNNLDINNKNIMQNPILMYFLMGKNSTSQDSMLPFMFMLNCFNKTNN